jgi:hypothetical protein
MTLLTITGLPCGVEALIAIGLTGVLCISLLSDVFKKRG